MTTEIEYKIQGGYQLHADYTVQTPLRPKDIVTEDDDYCVLTKDGVLSIRKGYVWDGPSTGPFKSLSSTKTFMRPSLVHDAMHQLARQNLWFRAYKSKFDDLLQAQCIEDGMWKRRANVWVFMLKKFAKDSVTEKGERKIITAP